MIVLQKHLCVRCPAGHLPDNLQPACGPAATQSSTQERPDQSQVSLSRKQTSQCLFLSAGLLVVGHITWLQSFYCAYHQKFQSTPESLFVNLKYSRIVATFWTITNSSLKRFSNHGKSAYKQFVLFCEVLVEVFWWPSVGLDKLDWPLFYQIYEKIIFSPHS